MTTIIKTTIEERNHYLRSSISEQSEEVPASIANVMRQTTDDYEKLVNKPMINGKVLIGNYEEEDPNVPAWAKCPTKPEYSCDEVNAVNKNNSIPLSELQEMINNIF